MPFLRFLKSLIPQNESSGTLDDEMHFHLEKQIQANVAAGMSPEEARRQALIAFGGVQQTREAVSEVRVTHFLQTFFHDFHHGMRMMRTAPGFAAVAVLTLALGVGANTAIFSAVSGILYPRWSAHNPEQLVVVREVTANSQGYLISIPDFEDYSRQNTTFQQLSLWIAQSVNLTGQERPDRLIGTFVSSSFFPMLDAEPLLGRTFLPDEDKPGAQRVAVLSFESWSTRFGSDQSILGRQITLNNEPYSIVGVLRPSFKFPFDSDVYITAQHHPSYQQDRNTKPLLVFGRVKDGVSRARARADLNAIAARLAQDYPRANAGIHVEVDTLREMATGPVRTPLLVLMGAVALVLLIVCANLANLLLTRGLARQREIAVRSALGASRRRIVRQLVSESLAIALLGGAIGVLMACWMFLLLLKLSPMTLDLGARAIFDARVLVFTAAVSILAALLFGIAPAWQSSAADFISALGAGNRSLGRSSASWLRSAFVVCQLALSIVLLVNAGLLMKSLTALLTGNPGFAPDHLLTAEYRLPRNKYASPAAEINFHRQVQEKLRNTPGVISAAYVQALPFSGNWGDLEFTVPGRPAVPGRSMSALSNLVSPDYFATMKVPILRGRNFSDLDELQTERVVIVSRTFAEQFFPAEDPLRRQIEFTDTNSVVDGPGPHLTRATIVGVAGDVKQITRREALRPEVYFPNSQVPSIFGTLVVRTAADPASVSDSLRRAVWSVDKDQPVWKIRTMDLLLQRDLAPDKFIAILIAAFGALALVLSALGTYGMLNNAVQQRLKEMGIRMALGATPGSVLGLVLRQGLKLASLGGVIGLICAFAATRLISSLLFGVSSSDIASYLAAWLVMTFVAGLACYLPARRATRVDPLVALRYE